MLGDTHLRFGRGYDLLPRRALQERRRMIEAELTKPALGPNAGRRASSCPCEQVAHRLGVPVPTSWRADAPCIEGVRYLVKGRSARALKLADDWQHVSCVAVRKST